MALFEELKKYVSRELNTLTAQELMEGESSQTTILVPGLTSPGVSILTAKPKTGKSFLCLGLALEVARGGQIPGRKGEAQEVLYLAIEDNDEQVLERLDTMLQGTPRPEGLHFGFSGWAEAGAELEELEAFLQAFPAVRLVIIDTLARFGSWKIGFDNTNNPKMAKLKALAERYDLAMILVHKEHNDWAEDLLLQSSLSGEVDTLIILERSHFQGEATLNLTGRDFPDTEIPLRFNGHTCSWEVREPGEINKITPERQELVKLLEAELLGLQDIAMTLNKWRANVANLLKKLVDHGLVDEVRPRADQINSWPDHE